MPADDLYWSPIEMDNDESSNFYKSYIDPWDLENYAYIRQHLDSLELSSDRSSPGVRLESSSTFSYIHGDGQKINENRKYDSLVNSDVATSNYAAIDEIDVKHERVNKRGQSESPIRSKKYEGEDENPYEDNIRDNSLMYFYETKGLRKIALPVHKNNRTRSYSYSCGDCGYEPINTHSQIYSRLDEMAPSPIYDDIRTTPAPKNFGLSSYGHLKIDYSYSWNNLNKYIYN